MTKYFLYRTDGSVFMGPQSLTFWRHKDDPNIQPAYYTSLEHARRLAREQRRIGNDCEVETVEVD